MIPAVDLRPASRGGWHGRRGRDLFPNLLSPTKPRRFRYRADPVTTIVAASFGLLTLLCSAQAQDERRTKVPVIGKITSASTRLAFSGKVQSLDLQRNLLSVSTVEGSSTEFFPIRKGMSILLAKGGKIKLTELNPGTNVIIYYEQKGDRRTVKEIVVLAARPAEEEKKSPPPS